MVYDDLYIYGMRDIGQTGLSTHGDYIMQAPENASSLNIMDRSHSNKHKSLTLFERCATYTEREREIMMFYLALC